MNALKTELQKLYADASKHSVYQSIPDFVSNALGYAESIDRAWRDDRPRLEYLLDMRVPAMGERWMDFGANTGFFTLSLAHAFPQTHFLAVEANPNHARFIERVADCFSLKNVEVLPRAVGLRELGSLPRADFLLHLNVLHHAGHDFDSDLVLARESFGKYAQHYLERLRTRTGGMFFQLGSNWGGDKTRPLVDVRADAEKLELFSGWLQAAGWHIAAMAYATREDGRIVYRNMTELADPARALDSASLAPAFESLHLDRFPGEFYRRPLFVCNP